jgi:membrane-bound lytic murein transglycosylase D
LATKRDTIKSKNSIYAASYPEKNEGISFSQHIIQRGDNLWTIAKKYNTTVKNICEANKITVNHILKIGTILSIQ